MAAQNPQSSTQPQKSKSMQWTRSNWKALLKSAAIGGCGIVLWKLGCIPFESLKAYGEFGPTLVTVLGLIGGREFFRSDR